MTILMDDPTTYLSRDSDVIAIMLAKNVASAMDVAKKYGVAIQVNMAGNKGVRVVTTLADAINVRAIFPNSTPWCIGTYDGWEFQALANLINFFGKPVTVDKALGVETVGRAWRPDTFRFGP